MRSRLSWRIKARGRVCPDASRGILSFLLRSPRLAAFVDEIPEVLGVGQRLILTEGEFRAEEEVGKGAFVEHAVNNDLLVDDFKIKAPVLSAKAVEGLAVTLDFTEAFIIEMLQIVFGDLEFIEEFQLLENIQLGNLSSTDFIEDDLKHSATLAEKCRRLKPRKTKA